MDSLRRMNKIRINIATYATLILSSFILFGCQAGGNGRQERAEAGTVIIAVDTAAENLDPRIGTSLASYRMQQLLYNYLVNQGPDGLLVPELVTHWERRDSEAVEGGESWIFHLKEGVTFHDGTPLTSRDVVYTFKSMLEPDFISRKSGAFSAVADVIARDTATVEFVMTEPQPAFLSNLPAVGIVPEGFPSDNSISPIGTGPFKFEGRNGLQQFVFSANESYFLGKPGINRIIVKAIPDDTTRALELMHGSVDLVINDLNVADAAYLDSWENMNTVKAPGLPYEYLGFNHEHPILGKRKVRQAIAHAINRDEIIENLLGGLARPASSPLLPTLWEGLGDFPRHEFDPEKAAQLLDEAGYPDPDGEGPRYRFTVEMKCSSLKTSRDMAVVYRQQLAEAGIEVTIRSTEWQTYYADIVNGNFSLYTLRWIGIIDPEFFGALFHSTSIPGTAAKEGAVQRASLNRGRYSNPEMDRLIEEAEQIQEPELRWQAYARVQQMMSEDMPYVDLWYRDNFAVHRSDLAGFELTLNASFGVLYKLHYLK